MPNRILREGLLESEAIDLLDAEAERFFVRLMLRCDDFGRYHANPAMLANMLFPLRRDIEPKMVENWLNQCQRAKLLRVYQIDGRYCLEIAKFHQRSRAQQSKFPDPPTDDGQMTVICLTDDRHPRTYSYSETETYSSARARAVTLPSLDEVIEEGRKRQIPAEVCEKWRNSCEERPLTPDGGWTLRNGQPMNMDKWQASLANYGAAFAQNEQHYGGKNGKNGHAKPQEGVWAMQQRIEAAQKEIERIQSNPSNKEQIPDSFDRRLKPEYLAKVKALKASISEMRQRLAGVEVAA